MSVKNLFLQAGRSQKSRKDKENEGVGVHRYGRPSFSAVSQMPCDSKLLLLLLFVDQCGYILCFGVTFIEILSNIHSAFDGLWLL